MSITFFVLLFAGCASVFPAGILMGLTLIMHDPCYLSFLRKGEIRALQGLCAFGSIYFVSLTFACMYWSSNLP